MPPEQRAERGLIYGRSQEDGNAPMRFRRENSADAFEAKQPMPAASVQQVCTRGSSIRHPPQRKVVMAQGKPSGDSETTVDNEPAPPAKESRVSSHTRAVEAPVSASMLEAENNLRAGDLVKAECPFTHEWHDATIRAVRGRGLIEVRWHNPGMDENGRPFSRYGDVWADKVRFVFRKDGTQPAVRNEALGLPEQQHSEAGVAAGNEQSEACDALQVGDECYARGRIVDFKWFKARVLAVRSKSPPIRIAYVETFEGEKDPLLLPEPRKAFVNEGDVRRDKPSQAAAHIDPPMVHSPDTSVALQAPAKEPPPSHGESLEDSGESLEDSGEPIDEDLMCSVCGRPDDEPNMLVCDCKKGFHTYCLVPRLSSIPEGDWRCPQCIAADCA